MWYNRFESEAIVVDSIVMHLSTLGRYGRCEILDKELVSKGIEVQAQLLITSKLNDGHSRIRNVQKPLITCTR